MVGLNVYNDENEKIGSIAELIVDRSGKLDAVVVGAGGFLGLGERDVAIPYGQINWVFTPVGSRPIQQRSDPGGHGKIDQRSRSRTRTTLCSI